MYEFLPIYADTLISLQLRIAAVLLKQYIRWWVADIFYSETQQLHYTSVIVILDVPLCLSAMRMCAVLFPIFLSLWKH